METKEKAFKIIKTFRSMELKKKLPSSVDSDPQHSMRGMETKVNSVRRRLRSGLELNLFQRRVRVREAAFYF